MLIISTALVKPLIYSDASLPLARQLFARSIAM